MLFAGVVPVMVSNNETGAVAMAKKVKIKLSEDWKDQKAGAVLKVDEATADEIVKAGAGDIVKAADGKPETEEDTTKVTKTEEAAAAAPEVHELLGVVVQQHTVNLGKGPDGADRSLGMVSVQGLTPGVGLMMVPGIFPPKTRVRISVTAEPAETAKQ